MDILPAPSVYSQDTDELREYARYLLDIEQKDEKLSTEDASYLILKALAYATLANTPLQDPGKHR